MSKNPFKYGSVVSGKEFCGRNNTIKELTDFIEVGQNIVLHGERRIGKTSLVCETARRMNKRSILTIDLMEVKTIEDVCLRILRAMVQTEQKSILKSLAHLRPTLTASSMTGDITIGLESAANLNVQSVTDILKLIGKKHTRKPMIVFFDEFQDILKLESSKELLAQLRAEIQYQRDVPYIFAGSVRNQMDDIFNSPDSPFFKSAIPMNIGPLSEQDFEEFLVKKFSLGGRSVDRAFLTEIFRLTNGVTGDVLQICEALWSVTDDKDNVDGDMLSKALELIFSREVKSYEIIMAGLTANSLNVLKALAGLGGKQVTSAEFVSKAQVANGSSVRKALAAMEKKKIVFRYESVWRFTNPFFGAWLQTF